MTLYKKLTFVMYLTLVPGCAIFNQDNLNSISNPPKIHEKNFVLPDAINEKADTAMKRPITDYYSAMDIAQTLYLKSEKCLLEDVSSASKDMCFRPSSDNAIKNYVYEGFGLVDAYCLRWFQHLDEVQRKVDLENANYNVISQLGTAVLGIASAGSDVVAGYGAANTAISGLSKNYANAFLLSPNSNKVKSHITQIMREKRTEIEGKLTGSQLNFKDFYIELERYADICTFSTAQEIVNTSLDTTKSTLNDDGTIDTQAKKLSEEVAKAISDKKAEDVVKKLEEEKNISEAENALLKNQLKSAVDANSKLNETNKTMQDSLEAMKQPAEPKPIENE